MIRTLCVATALSLAVSLSVVCAQTNPDVGEKERAAVKKSAQDMLHAYTSSQYGRFADFVCPEVLESLGGHEKLTAQMKAVDERMQAAGWAYGRATVSDPGRFAQTGKTLVTTVSYTVDYVGTATKRKSESYLIGLSSDGGRSWKFVEGRKITRDNVKDIFPNFPDGIELPGGKGK